MLFAALLLAACGKKGPLYLPKDAAAANPGTEAVSPTPILSEHY
jgi:predicted small lipoprotein YifL